MARTLSQLVDSIEQFTLRAGTLTGGGEVMVNGITCDSRKVRPGFLFIALRGARDDGHAFISEAVSNGAAAILVDRAWFEENGGSSVPAIVVKDALSAMAPVSAAFYGNPEREMEIFGVTGTNGKTTTTFLVESAMSPCAVLGTIEYRIANRVLDRCGNTTPLSLDLFGHFRTIADAGIKKVVMEVSSHALGLHRVDGIEFSGGIFTNITPEHLDFHFDMDDYFAAKRRLFDMTPSGPLCIGTVSPRGRTLFVELAREGRRAIAFGEGARDLWKARGNAGCGWLEASSFSMGSWGLAADLGFRLPEGGEGTLQVRSELTGLFNLLNMSGAASLLLDIGIEPERVAAGIESVKRVPGRFDPVRRNGVTAIVDYAHTGDSLENVLSALGELKAMEGGNGRIITVFGCGGDRDRTKRPVMGAIASRMSDILVVTSDNPRTEKAASIIDEIRKGIDPYRPDLHTEEDRRRAIRMAIGMARPGDFVLVAGKGHEDYQILGREKIHFDDREEIEKAFWGND